MKANEELLNEIAMKLDVHQLLDILGLDMFDLVNHFDEEIGENEDEFRRACR